MIVVILSKKLAINACWSTLNLDLYDFKVLKITWWENSRGLKFHNTFNPFSGLPVKFSKYSQHNNLCKFDNECPTVLYFLQ